MTERKGFNEKHFELTDKNFPGQWSGYRDGRTLRCFLCGVFFAKGDVIRWVWCGGTLGTQGNCLVCRECDGEDVLERIVAACTEQRQRFWWAEDSEHAPPNPNCKISP